MFWHRLESTASIGAGSAAGFDAVGVQFEPGRVGSGLAFSNVPGAGLRFQVDEATVDLGSFTIEGWIQRSRLGTAAVDGIRGVILHGTGPGSMYFAIQTSGNLLLGVAADTAVLSEGRIQDLDWHHVAVTRSGQTVRFYIDGRAAGVATFASRLLHSRTYAIGGLDPSEFGVSGTFRGMLDEIAFHRGALPGSYFEQVHAAGSAGKRPAEAMDFRWLTAGSVLPGEPFAVEAEIRNASGAGVGNRVATFTGAPGLRFLSGISTVGSAVVGERSVVVTIPELPAGGTAQVRLQAVADGQAGARELRLDLEGSSDRLTVAVIDGCVEIPGMVGRWPMDGTGRDEVGGGVGVLRGTASWEDGPPGRGRVLKLDGGASALLVADPKPLGLDTFSLELWFQRNEATSTGTTSLPRVLAASTEGSFSVAFREDGTLIFSQVEMVLGSIPKTVTDRDWHHLVMVRIPGTMAFYLDGVHVGSTEFAPTFGPSTAFAFGGLPNPSFGSYYGFVGSIDEARIYNRPLESAEIQALAQGGGTSPCPPRAAIEPVAVPATTETGETTRAVLRVRNIGSTAIASPVVRLAWNGAVQFQAASSDGNEAVPETDSARLGLAALAPGESRDVIIDLLATGVGTAELSVGIYAGSVVGTQSGAALVRIEVGRECTGPIPGLMAWFRGEGTGSDAAGGNPGMVDASVGYGPGRVGQGFLLDGTGGVRVEDPPALGPEMTLDAWIRPTALTASPQGIVFQELAGTTLEALGFGLAIQGTNATAGTIPAGNLCFALGGLVGLPDEGGQLVDARAAIPMGKWSHVALSVGAGRVRVYVNGMLTRELAGLGGTWAGTDAPLWIGTRGQRSRLADGHFRGMIDEVGLYARELGLLEVEAVHRAGSIGRCDADLSVAWATIRTRAAIGEPFPVRLAIGNQGTRPVSGVVLTLPIPPGWNVRSITTSFGTISQGTHGIRADLGTLAAGTEADVEAVLEPVAPGAVMLEATVIGEALESVTKNNSARANVLAGPSGLRVVGGVHVEGDAGTTRDFEVQLQLSAPVSHRVTVDYATGPVAAGSGFSQAQADLDYLPTEGSLTFDPGETVKVVSVTVLGDDLHELDEVFGLVLSNVSGAEVEDSDGHLVIRDDEPIPVVRVDPARVVEGSEAVFALRLSGRSSVDISLDWETEAGTAQAPEDFTAGSGRLVIAAGQLSGEVRIPVIADGTPESNEHFLLRVAVAPASVGRAIPGNRMWAQATLLDDDGLSGAARGFEWVVPSTGTPGVPVPVELRAVDGLGQVVTGYNGTVTLSGVNGSGIRPRSGRAATPSILLSEVIFGPVDGVKLQNVTGEEVDASGWRLSFYDHTVWPLPRASFVLPPGTRVAPGAAFRIREAGTGSGAYPEFELQAPLAWGTNTLTDSQGADRRRAAVLLERADGAVADFVSALGAQPGEIDVPQTLGTADWDGMPVGSVPLEGKSLQRSGSRIEGAADWEWMPSTPELRPNLWVRNPFDETLRTPVTPSEVTLTEGRWSGTISPSPTTEQFRFLATDTAGREGLSDIVTFAALSNPLRLTMDPTPGPFVLRNSGHTFRWFVTNTGPSAVRDVSLTVAFDPALGIGPGGISLFRPSQGTVAHLGTAEDGTYRFRAMFGIVDPGKSVMFEVTANVAWNLSPFLTGDGLLFRVMTELSHNAPPAAPVTHRQLWTLPYSAGLAEHGGGLVAWWRGEDNALDSVGGHHGVADGVGYATRADTRSFSFDGSARVVVPDSPGIRSTPRQYWTVSAWVRPRTGSPERMVILEKSVATTGRSITLTLHHGRPAVEWNGVLHVLSSESPDLRDDQWHFIRWSILPARDAVRVKADNTGLDESIRLSSSIAVEEVGDGPLRIGGGAVDGGFHGEIDEVSLYRWIGQPISHWTETLPSEVGSGALGRIHGDIQVDPVRIAQSLPAAVVGRPYTLTARVSNRGYLAANEVTVMIVNDRGLPIQSVRRDGVPVPGTGANVLVPLGRLGPGEGTEVEWTFVATPAWLLGPSPRVMPSVHPRAGIRDRTRQLQLSSIQLHADKDNDGISDTWETFNGLSSEDPDDGLLDADGDGFSNRAEYEAGTNPRDPASWPSLTWRISEDGMLVLEVPTRLAADYSLETRTHLTDVDPWIPLQRQAGNGGAIEFRVGPTTEADIKIYTVRPIPRW